MLRTSVSILVIFMVCYFSQAVFAKEHKISRMGNSSTSFYSKALKSPDDVRRMLRDVKKKKDIEAVLQKAGYAGTWEDLDKAAETGDIGESSIAPGTSIPWVALRRHGKGDILTEIVWTGKKPLEVYTLKFDSNGKGYTFYIPKPCSNFWFMEGVAEAGLQKGEQSLTLVPAAWDVCVTQSADVTANAMNLDGQAVTVTMNGQQIASGTVSGGSFHGTISGQNTPGNYEIVVASGDVKATGTLVVKACPPVCGISVSPVEVLRNQAFIVDASGSKVADGVTVGMKSVKVDILRDDQTVQSFELNAPDMTNNTVMLKKPGTYTVKAVATDAIGQTSTNACEGSLLVWRPKFFVDGLVGKERLVREEETDSGDVVVGGRCAALAGVKFGWAPMIADNADFEAAIGVKINLEDGDNSAVFGDVAVNGLFDRGFIGGGLSFWDLNLDDTRTVAALIHGGINLTKTETWQFIVEGRLPLDQFDDIENNYQFWGGIRYRFGK